MPAAVMRPPIDMKGLANALNQAQEGTGEVKRVLCSATFCPRLPGLTKMISKLSKEGAFRKGLEVFHALPELGISYDTTITNAAISACDKGNQWQAALEIFRSMPELGLSADAITYSSVISALAKGKQWAAALQVFEDMQAQGVEADVVTCCSLISALERGGQWQLAEQLFKQMCCASQHEGRPGPLQHLATRLDQQQPQVDALQASPISVRSFSSLSWTTNAEEGNNQASQSGRSSFDSRGSGGSELMVGSPRGDAHSSPLLSFSGSPIQTCRGAQLGRTASWSKGVLPGLDIVPDQLIASGYQASHAQGLPTLTGSAEPVSMESPADLACKALSAVSGSSSTTSRGMDTPDSASPTNRAASLGRTVSDAATSLAEFKVAGFPDASRAGLLAGGDSAALRAALKQQLDSAASSTASELQPATSPFASQGTTSPMLPPIKLSQDPSPPKPSSPRKRFSTLSSIIEGAPDSSTGSPVSPGTPKGVDKTVYAANQLASVCEKLGLQRHHSMPVTQQFSVNAISVGSRSIMDLVKPGLKAGKLTSGAMALEATTQLAIDGCPLPVCLERGQDASGNPDPTSPMVPRLKHMNVSRIAPNRVCCNALLAAFARARPAQWQKALTLLEAMTEAGGEVSPDVVSYNTCLKACGSAAKLDQAIQVYKNMVRHGVWPSITTFGTLLTAASHAGSYETVKQVWQWLLDSGLEVSSACIHAYVSALAKRGHWEEARLVLQQTLGRRSFVKQDPVLRQAAQMLPPSTSTLSLSMATPPVSQPLNLLPQLGPEHLLHQLAQTALTAPMQDQPLLASEAMTAFQQCGVGPSTPGHAFASLLCVLGCGGLWDTGIRVYNLVPVKEVLESGTVSNLVAGHAAAGQLFWALHYWLALRQQGGASPSLQAQQALLCACRDRNAWQPALHILHTMLASQVLPDRLCYGAVMQALAKAGLLQEAAQVLLLMPQKGLWPDALLMADVLSCVDVAHIAAKPDLGGLLQAMSVCGLSDAKRLAEVGKALSPTSLPHLSLHLLNCLPLETPGCGETHWTFVGILILSRQLAAAVQVTYHGHAVGALRHYKPFISALNRTDGQEEEPLMSIDLTTCGTESALMVLLAWSCSFSQALDQGTQFKVEAATILVGPKSKEREQQRTQVITAARSILAPSGETGTHILLLPTRIPCSPPLGRCLASVPEDGRIKLPLPLLTAWVASVHDVARSLLAPLPLPS